MKTLILVRHGSYKQVEERRLLSDVGRAQIGALSQKLKAICEEAILVFSSPALRAVESAEILCGVLNTSWKECEFISTDYGWYSKELLEMVVSRMDECETMILVTHLECIEHFGHYFASKIWNQHSLVPECVDLEKGEAIVIERDTFDVYRPD